MKAMGRGSPVALPLAALPASTKCAEPSCVSVLCLQGEVWGVVTSLWPIPDSSFCLALIVSVASLASCNPVHACLGQ